MFQMKKLAAAALVILMLLVAVMGTTRVLLARTAGKPAHSPAKDDDAKRPAPAPAGEKSVAGKAGQPEEALKQLGTEGCFVVRSVERWKQLRDILAGLGWKQEADSFAATDFSKQMLVGVFKYGDVGDQLHLRKVQTEPLRVEFGLGYIIYDKRVTVEYGWNFIFTAVPVADQATVWVGSFHAMNGGDRAAIDKAKEEWVATTPCDSVDGLSVSGESKQARVKAGEDIAVQVKLSFQNPVKDAGQFATKRDSVQVWDGTWSAGYRNHAFLVELPDGKTTLLRPAVQDAWDKNIPYPVVVSAEYVLPAGYKSLKALGLNTSAPGTYKITPLYMENGSRDASGNAEFWGGFIAGKPLSIEVAK